MGRLHCSMTDRRSPLYSRIISVCDRVSELEYLEKPREALILGTGWSNPNVLENEGFVCEKEISFSMLGMYVASGSGHPNAFKFGKWHGKDVVISCGRFHLFQDRNFGEESLIRQWMRWLISFMNGSKRIVITSAVGSLSSERLREDTLVMPTGIVSAHLPMPYLIGSDGEFVMSEHLLWENGIPESECSDYHNEKWKVFFGALNAIERFLPPEDYRIVPYSTFNSFKVSHYFIQGPGFGGATERKLWKSWGMDTVGMSLDPELRLIALENLDNRPSDVIGAYHETDIRVFPTLFISDAHDLPNNIEIQARAKAMAPKLGKFLSHVVKSEW